MSEKTYPKKCNPKKQTFCQVQLLERPNGKYGKGRGFSIADMMNFKTHKITKRLIYFWGTKQRQFQLMPFCPVCGVDLYMVAKLKKEKAK